MTLDSSLMLNPRFFFTKLFIFGQFGIVVRVLVSGEPCTGTDIVHRHRLNEGGMTGIITMRRGAGDGLGRQDNVRIKLHITAVPLLMLVMHISRISATV